ncbi:four-carbon acid sugar kinase family protein [Saccharicrinis sp. FJH62]|uniref:four-carbon acid sugar kinase family protein n=1 Tax=Saccharicrinis sp. FJH62 TaxID=3344657 RepID=UPI0035D4C43D
MIAVIADDFTGAAEIGGIGLRHGLRVMIETRVEKVKDVDLLIIATNTRALSKTEAAKEIDKITRKLLKLDPEFIFKKLDSVLRGNVAAELHAQMKASANDIAVIVAGNPYFKRIINKGIYYVEGIPLAQTSFGNDPEYSINSSHVTEIIGNEFCEVSSIGVDEKMPANGLVVGDITNDEEMTKWTMRLNNQMVIAGGAGFFNAILFSLKNGKIRNEIKKEYTFGSKTLFIFGSAYPKSSDMDRMTLDNNVSVVNMPAEIFNSADFEPDVMRRWVSTVSDHLRADKNVFVSIKYKYKKESGLSVRLSKNIGEFVAQVNKSVALEDLFIEGGATASAVFKSLEINRLMPFCELDAGIIQMKVDKFPNMKITTKPGSYKWPVDKVRIKTHV